MNANQAIKVTALIFSFLIIQVESSIFAENDNKSSWSPQNTAEHIAVEIQHAREKFSTDKPSDFVHTFQAGTFAMHLTSHFLSSFFYLDAIVPLEDSGALPDTMGKYYKATYHPEDYIIATVNVSKDVHETLEDAIDGDILIGKFEPVVYRVPGRRRPTVILAVDPNMRETSGNATILVCQNATKNNKRFRIQFYRMYRLNVNEKSELEWTVVFDSDITVTALN